MDIPLQVLFKNIVLYRFVKVQNKMIDNKDPLIFPVTQRMSLARKIESYFRGRNCDISDLTRDKYILKTSAQVLALLTTFATHVQLVL